MIAEYRFFRSQAEKVSVLQAEYKNYVLSVRKLLRGSSLVKDPEQSAATAAVEKKNGEESGALLIVNRNPDYVKESSLAFFKRQRMEHLFRKIATTEWIEYTEQALAAQEVAKKPAHKLAKSRRARNSRGLRRRFAMHAKKPVSANMFADKSSKIFSWPIDPSRFWLSSMFGPRKNPRGWKFHQGIDMAAIRGTPVKSVAPGEVMEARVDPGYGKTILLSHGNQYQTRYAHLDKILVSVGQYVERGTVIGRVGATGNVRSMGFDGSHLHFEVHSGGRRVNPLYLLG